MVARVPGRFVLAASALLCALLAAPGVARAGTYEVVACDAAAGGASSSWTATATPLMTAHTTCPTNLKPSNGITAAARVNVGTAAPFAEATQAFDAPAGTSIVALDAQFMIHRKASHWGVGIYADGKMLVGCQPNSSSFCLFSTAWPGVSQKWSWTQGVRRVHAQTSCWGVTGCPTGPPDVDPFPDRASIRLYSARVRLRDDTTPAVRDLLDGTLTSGAWLRGNRSVSYAASDNVGIRSTRFLVDGRQRDDLQRSCDFSRRIPCSDLPSARYTLDTQTLPDGQHELRVEAVDTAGNVGKLTAPFRTDNTPPDIPATVTVEGGQGWRSVNGFRLGWGNPPSAAPIAAAHYEVCDTATGDCLTGVRRADGIDAISDLDVPGPGHYEARVWLEDAAGNVNPANRSEPVQLRFDDVRPGQASPAGHERWLNAFELDEPIEMGVGQTVPVSGVAGYSVTVDGTDPDATIDTDGDVYRIAPLAQGVTVLRARAVSGSGVASSLVGETRIRADRTPPATAVAGAPDPSVWQRIEVQLRIAGTDQPGLAGMTAAPPLDPVEHGAHVAYRIDGGELQRVRGAEATVVIAGDGEHAVVYRAVDAAGNASPERTARLRIDRTAPELVVFEATDPSDPRTVRVAASDRASGVAAGTIELRRAGSGAAWRRLATTRVGNRFVAQLDDDALRGSYVLRARVSDRAGNEATGDRRRDGSPVVVDTTTLRVPTRLTAGLVRKGTRGLTAATVEFGRTGRIRGTLVRGAGTPVAGATVDVLARVASAGAGFAKVGHVRTGPSGGFGYFVDPGPSRTLRFRYAGSPVNRSSQADVTLRVPASATIRASRRSVRNGERVGFTGRLRGRPIPPRGKVVDLQAHYRGRWRTFATPRAAADGGAWRYTYRFGATRGRLVYRFRVKVRPEASYPYALGYSNTTSVTVTGR